MSTQESRLIAKVETYSMKIKTGLPTRTATSEVTTLKNLALLFNPEKLDIGSQQYVMHFWYTYKGQH